MGGGRDTQAQQVRAPGQRGLEAGARVAEGRTQSPMGLYLSPLPASVSVSDHNETKERHYALANYVYSSLGEMPMRLQAVWKDRVPARQSYGVREQI